MEPSEHLHSLLYISTARASFTQPQLEELLTISRANNERAGISGLLLFRDNAFMQLIEGPRREVQALYHKVLQDQRHSGIVTLDEGPSNERLFPDWHMGFHNLRSSEAAKLPGYRDFRDFPLDGRTYRGTPAMAMKLLRTFQISE